MQIDSQRQNSNVAHAMENKFMKIAKKEQTWSLPAAPKKRPAFANITPENHHS